MEGSKLDKVLKIILTTFLFAIPISLAMVIWYDPVISGSLLAVGLATANLAFGIAEVMFLYRAVIFPKGGRKWWRENW